MMGKEKDKAHDVPFGAFSRMNYLYQASQLVATTYIENPLSNYYNKIIKDISKKLVEKLHPDMKRTICIACNNPLTPTADFINVKVKPTKNKKKKKCRTQKSEIGEKHVKINNKNDKKQERYKSDRIVCRNKKPNRVKWQCRKCGFSKKYLLRPSYIIWNHKEQV